MWKPPSKLTVSQWADQFRKLSSEASAEPGQWTTSRAEYQRGIMDAFSDPSVTDVVAMTSAQVGKTEVVGNVAAYFIACDPSPILVVQPNEKPMAEASANALEHFLDDHNPADFIAVTAGCQPDHWPRNVTGSTHNWQAAAR